MTRGDLVVTRWGARFQGRFLPCSIGKGLFSKDKIEGDGATPGQPMRLLWGGYRPDRIGIIRSDLPFRKIGPNDIWSDDVNDSNYNHLKSLPEPRFSFERLRRSDPLYDIFLVTDYNYPNAAPGKGSAIFIHIWRKRRHPTEGCIAFSKANLLWILDRWTDQSRVLIRSNL